MVTQSALATSSANLAEKAASSSAETSGPLSSSSVWLPSCKMFRQMRVSPAMGVKSCLMPSASIREPM